MNLFVVNEYFDKRGMYDRYGSFIVKTLNDLDETKRFVDEIQKLNPNRIYFVNDVYRKEIIYRTENGWLK